MLFKGVKGQDLPVTTLVIIILAIVVFAIVLFIFSRGAGDVSSSLGSCHGTCTTGTTCTPSSPVKLPQGDCKSGQTCCGALSPNGNNS